MFSQRHVPEVRRRIEHRDQQGSSHIARLDRVSAAIAPPQLLKDMAEEGADDDRITEIDRAFHLTIASASGNRAITHTVETLWRMRTEIQDVRDTHKSVCHHDASVRHREHAAIVDALRRRDSVAARAAMRQHFSRLLEAILDATEQREVQALKLKSAASRARFLMSAQLV
ncbi:FadR/GntR family transcriptional regulator [Sphingomonas sp. HMP9]|uniref:FadR/GntR family transcriptional regulator n=1 Tax=Sphingomonas sp. HMP9 TaxID=1517554 RepID=UPI001E57A29D|nr:FCD domain-containing protein [Sphingomonas sp. HMP9]